MKAPQIFTIPLVPMSRNARDRAHWAERSRELADWTLLIPMCAEEFRQTNTRRRVEIVFRKARGPLSDPDNLTARAKVPLDALVRRKWLTDDSPKYLKLIVREEVTGKRGQTIIAVSEMKSLTPSGSAEYARERRKRELLDELAEIEEAEAA